MAHVNNNALVDLLCERLAVETGGVDIYQAAIAKIDDPMLAARLTHFMEEEAKHRDLLAAYLDKLGVENRDTPSARLARMEGQAYMKLVGESTTPVQVINVLLTIELMDENAWEMIVNLGRDLHDDEMVRTLSGALKEEKEHLRGVRGMMAALTRESLVVADAIEQ
ncbi:MAG: ferritin Dps family protein [Myxococcales bacterium]|nr:ferritin Dps family protein [Myxococcales bacterium]